ncbi:TonB box domain protein, partial [mine drainage metagenome]
MTPGMRGTLHLEDARVLSHTSFEAQQFVLRLAAPACAAHAQPGSFVHLTCDPAFRCAGRCRSCAPIARAGWIRPAVQDWSVR